MNRKLTRHQRQDGFTIVEMMVATLVFSVVLLIITTGVIRATQLYYKGITLVKTQNAARSVMDSVSQAIQFSGGVISWPDPGSTMQGAGCIGNQKFDFHLGSKLETDGHSDGTQDLQDNYALAVNPSVASCASSTAATLPDSTFTELLSPHMRLTRLTVAPITPAPGDTDRLYNVAVTVVYGDYDQFCDGSLTGTAANGPGGCGPNATAIDPTINNPEPFSTFLTSPKIACRSGAGSNYCAISSLNTVVQQRLVLDK